MTSMRVWWIRNPPRHPKYFPVLDIEQAKRLLRDLAARDLRYGKFVTANAGGLEILEDDDWSEYYNEGGMDINEMLEEEVQE